MKWLGILILPLALVACQEHNVQYPPHHHLKRTKLDPTTEAHVYNWEAKLASGELLLHVNAQDFLEFHRALIAGVFNPNTELSIAEINRIGKSVCTSSTSDATIGLRRFERTLTMAPEFADMTDAQGQRLTDWIMEMRRPDLLKSLETIVSQLRTNKNEIGSPTPEKTPSFWQKIEDWLSGSNPNKK
jgi:hypothetical protein